MRDWLRYEPETGHFYWLKTSSPRGKAGARAGGIGNQGYAKIKIHGKTYQAHRLAWWFAYNKWPENEIDHINGDRSDNRLKNLRDVPRSLNQRNSARRRDNISGIVGVHRVINKNTGYWVATWFDNKICQKWFNVNKLGEETALLSAIEYRKEKQRELGGFTERHGA
jgi:hypothetical protein